MTLNGTQNYNDDGNVSSFINWYLDVERTSIVSDEPTHFSRFVARIGK